MLWPRNPPKRLFFQKNPLKDPGPQNFSYCFHTCRPSVRPFVPTLQIFAKQSNFQVKIVIATGETVCLAEWIIDDTCLVMLDLWIKKLDLNVIYIINKMSFWYFNDFPLDIHKIIRWSVLHNTTLKLSSNIVTFIFV